MPSGSTAHHISGISYSLRVSSRARSIRLKMSPYDGLIVIIPEGYDRSLVPAVIESRLEWIRKVQRTFEQHGSGAPGSSTDVLPDEIVLAGIGESWQVRYRSVPGAQGILVREQEAMVLELSGAVEERAGCIAAIENWLKWRAKVRLVPLLVSLASEHGFAISGVTVRKQKSRWGSCSSRGNINLNLKLLFLPPHLVRYIMIHELCHTLHMNHSSRYWAAVARYDPEYATHDRLMRHAWSYVPGWFVRPADEA